MIRQPELRRCPFCQRPPAVMERTLQRWPPLHIPPTVYAVKCIAATCRVNPETEYTKLVVAARQWNGRPTRAALRSAVTSDRVAARNAVKSHRGRSA